MDEIINDAFIRLRDLLEELNITAYRISKSTGKGVRKYQAMLNGETKPSFETFIEIISVFPEINEKYIFRGEEPKLNESKKVIEGDPKKIVEEAANRNEKDTRSDYKSPKRITNKDLAELNTMKALLEEKDERIKLLQEIVEMQRKNMNKE